MKICFATSECVPFVKTGGLADVAGALPRELAKLGCKVKLFLPLYRAVDASQHGILPAPELANIPVQMADRTVLFNGWYGKLPDSKVEAHFIECPQYFERDAIYTDKPDEDERFILFQHAVIHILQRYNWAPDVVHCNDWQTGLIPALLKYNYGWDTLFKNTATLMTIHNIGYQGRFPATSLLKAGLPAEQFYPGSPLELDGDLCFLKAGITLADKINTVSEQYAEEIQTPAYGAGLESILASRRHDLTGILNGVDTQVWSPESDGLIPYPYSASKLANKKKNKQALLRRAGLPFNSEKAVLGMVTRLVGQKGVALLQPIIRELMQLPLQMVVLGSGDKKLERFLRRTAQGFPDSFSATIGYDNQLSHLITAGSDMFVMPSQYEPCGLNQMYSLAYGAVPIVRRTGGLADTVKDYHEYYQAGNGFSFNDFSANALLFTIRRALDIFKSKRTWREIQHRGMVENYSWLASAKKYKASYRATRKSKSDVAI